ncbi:MAG: phage portal protein [Planctomycetaceae bacterium]|jgi:lambda family phage portal protein|nr:phage portal protein [Planctomycetaceae bacterium]
MLKFLKKFVRSFVGNVKQKYDAAQTNRDNASAWRNADNYSPDAANTPEVRRTLRNRARYETANNSYARGLVLTLADACIGTGARLQMLTTDAKFNSVVETEFTAWAEAIVLGEKLQTMRKAKCVDGEAFGVMIRNPRVHGDVKIDLRIIEADRVTTPYPDFKQKVDGINYDKYGNPISYTILKEHPGDSFLGKILSETETVSANFVIHWFRKDRAEQSRGISELTSVLPLFSQLRRYTLAVIAAAETAADFAAVIHTNMPANGEAAAVEYGKHIELEKRTATVLPEGWNIDQIKAEQPQTTYQMFKREILTEIGRCMNTPANIILGDSSNYNYASGRLDHQTFFRSIKIEQNSCDNFVLYPLLSVWYADAVNVGIVPEKIDVAEIKKYAKFFYDGHEHVDPIKEAKAAAERINAKISNLAIENARLGNDWEEVVEQFAREQKKLKTLGIDEKVQPTENKQPKT